MTDRRLSLGVLLGTVSLMAVQPALAAIRSQSGTLPDGTAFQIDLPDNWNGALLLDLDYAGRPNPADSPNVKILLERGYAVGGVTRLFTGWAVPKAVDNLVEVGGRFDAAYGKPRWTIAFGASLGGHTANTAAHLRPDRFSGAVAMCGSPAGGVAIWNSKLDPLYVAKTLIAPNADLPIVDVPQDFNTRGLPAWKATLAAAQTTPRGRARIALAAVLGQLPVWSVANKPEPAEGDIDALQEGLYDSLAGGPLPLVAQAMSSRRQITLLAGGNVSWNTGVDYAAALNRLPGKALVAALYKEAGLSLDADLKILAKAPRIAADPKAVLWMAPQNLNGELRVPVLTLHNVGDQIASAAGAQAFEVAVREAGTSALVRQTFTHAAGHCAFSPVEIAAVADTLKARLDTGAWPDTSAQAMSARAHAAGVGPVRFITYRPDPFLRRFTRDDLARTERLAAGAASSK